MVRVVDNTDSSQFESDTLAPNKPCAIARYLASYLNQNQFMYTEHYQAVIHEDELAWVIQDFIDSCT